MRWGLGAEQEASSVFFNKPVEFTERYAREIKLFGSVLVADFVNCDLLNLPGLTHDSDEVRRQAYQERDRIVNEIIRGLVELRIGSPIIVAYVRPGFGRLAAIDQLTATFPEIRYYASANTPVSLMGAVVDSAYVAFGDRNSTP